MKAQIVDIPFDEYIKHPALSKTALTVFEEAPAMYDYYFNKGNPRPPATAYQKVGTAVHTKVLERGLWDKHFHVMPNGIRRAAKEAPFKEQLALAKGRTIVNDDEHDRIVEMTRALRADPAAGRLLQSKEGEDGYTEHLIEQSIFWTDEETGLDLKCRPDDIRVVDEVFLDLKVTGCSAPAEFARTAWNFSYDISVAMISEAYRALSGGLPAEYVFIAIESKPPHLVTCFTSMEAFTTENGVGQSVYSVGQFRFRNALRRFKECKLANKWPGYTTDIKPLELPTWEMRRLEKHEDGL